ncbi:13377_t:CDS:2 [Dentiscutata erythropus]|uniref:13377_t:CDS:1 n=1 Tax=Dentiscutata erythropus TaxID=1348616 RepID=A0A9N9IV22_9GLOM|nr:13377_t:CDS:2 [Dentiscutata erythropus]
MYGATSKSISQNKNDGQIPKASKIDSSKESASDESIIEYSYNKKRKKAKVKKLVDRLENPPSEIKLHLVLECKDVPGDTKKKYLHIITTSKSSKKKMKVEIQSKITDKFQSAYIDQSQENLINKALTRFFTCCGILF